MATAVIIMVLAGLVIAGFLVAFWKNAHSDLPKGLPPPLPDEPEDDWGEKGGKARGDHEKLP